MNGKYVFGPLHSRRLGKSLGVSLIPPKTCQLDCIYCEAKATTDLTCCRKEYVPTADVIRELDDVLSTKPELDYITFSGAGEPMLHSGITTIINHIKSNHPDYKLCLLTNAVALDNESLWQDINKADLIVPSFDGSNAEEFKAINRPEASVDFDRFVQKFTAFTRQCSSTVKLELFIVPGINDSDDSIARFAALLKEMRLDSIELNSLDRPGTVDNVPIPDEETFERFIKALSPIAPCAAIRRKAAHGKNERRWPQKSYFRAEIDALEGYAPGEQPKFTNLVKLNTNENPWPPSPAVEKAWREMDWKRLNRYPDPCADKLRDAFAAVNGVKRENVIVGNGSDDLLTMIFRAFTSPELPVAIPEPTYSLYPVLAAMQGAKVIKIALDEEKNFDLPGDFLAQAEGANLLIFPRPNAPTGNAFAKEEVRRLCREFNGIVVIDEAYGDFSADNCMEFASLFPNVLVMRTMSKSYGLAGLRLGYAVGAKELIDGLMKLKDSYNVDMISQVIAEAAFLDREYFNARCEEIKAQRALLGAQLEKLNFRIIPSEANFLFVSPPDGDGERCFKLLRESAVVVRYFPKAAGGKYVRITIGTPDECARLMEILNGVYAK
ncbi:MAG: histidinol-phosphate transaminase [Lentisphaeria bacterium]|nr:histidinol-phosphate transaminase [Lentisphaeria bacterium]